MMEKVVSRDGTPIAVWRSGKGPPLVLVHGTTADHSRWAPALPAFEEHFTVLAMDRRGRGESGDGDDYDLAREVEDVAAVVEAAGPDVDLLGHSYGAVCALEAAAIARGVRKLVLYEPPLGFVHSSEQVYDHLQELLDAGRPNELLSYFLQEVAGLPPDQVDLMRSLPAWEARLAAAHTIPREEGANREYTFDPDRFRGVDAPTLFLLGGDSPAGFKTASEKARETLPDCRVVVMPGQRHAAIDTATELFTSEVLSFLRE